METTDLARTCTDAPRVTDPSPRPAPPKQRLTARPLSHDLPTAPYGPRSFTRADLNAAMVAEGLRPVGIGEPAAWRAFRDDA